MQLNYAIQFGGRLKKFPTNTGYDFWLELTRTQPPLIDGTELEIFICPFSDKKPAVGVTSYRGPKADVNELDGDAPVGCCDPGHHPKGKVCVIFKSGDVVEIGPDDPRYGKAAAGTRGVVKKN